MGGGKLGIHNAYAYLVHPGKSVDKPLAIPQVEIELMGKLNDMLHRIFVGADADKDFDITFDGADSQINDFRELIIKFQSTPTLENGRPIAERLQRVTDRRSGIGLLFLLQGAHGLKKQVVVSRFPTDQAVLADLGQGGLAVKFLEQVFIKRLSSYKALLLADENPSAEFWSGRAIDRQAGGLGENISDYWLKDFLKADFSETPALGTRRLAVALKNAIKSHPDIAVKSQIAQASSLAANALYGKSTSVEEFCIHFGFSQNTTQAVKAALPKSSLFGKRFQFDSNEFRIVAPYRSMEMTNGAVLSAPAVEFDDVFKQIKLDNGEVEISTHGIISDQRLARK